MGTSGIDSWSRVANHRIRGRHLCLGEVYRCTPPLVQLRNYARGWQALKPGFEAWVRAVSRRTGGVPASISELTRAFECGVSPKEASRMCLAKSARGRVHWNIQMFQGLLYAFIILLLLSILSAMWDRPSLDSSAVRIEYLSWEERLAPVGPMMRAGFNFLILIILIRAMRCRPEKFGLLVD